jgi:predicted metallopeptidase
MTKKTRRPNLGRAIKAVIRDAARRLPELAHIEAERILVVAGEARRASRATVLPLAFADSGKRVSANGKLAKPIVRIRRRKIDYVITFRPRFFRGSTPEQRIETILHELWHMAPAFDGTLAAERRHDRLSPAAFGERFRPLVRRYLAECPPALLADLSQDGEVRMRMWLERPQAYFRQRRKDGSSRDYRCRVVFTETQLFYGTVELVTPRFDRARRRPRPA